MTKKKNNIDNFLEKLDWRVNENSNNGDPTPSGLMLYLANTEIAKHTLNNVYPKEISDLHRNGDLHIHDLGYGTLLPYCCGWSLEALIKEGINKIQGKASSAPAKHLSSLMIQMVNFLGCLQMEASGAMAFNNVDTYLSAFVKNDNLSFYKVKQFMQQLVFNLNIPSRWGCLSDDSEILTKNG
jgi:anaerobic ribonucleoside-triphosphate reductase